jgi:hypothetical protein
MQPGFAPESDRGFAEIERRICALEFGALHQ